MQSLKEFVAENSNVYLYHRSAQRKCIPVAFNSYWWQEKTYQEVYLTIVTFFFFKKSLEEVQWVEEGTEF